MRFNNNNKVFLGKELNRTVKIIGQPDMLVSKNVKTLRVKSNINNIYK